MPILSRWYQAQHLAPLMLAASAVMLLAAGAALLRSPGPDGEEAFASLDAMRGAYERVVPGRTSEKELARLGLRHRALSRHAALPAGGAGIFHAGHQYRI